MFQLSCEKHCQPKNQGLTTKFSQEFIQVTPKAQLQLPSVEKIKMIYLTQSTSSYYKQEFG